MPELKVTVLVEQDGAPISGFPLVRRVVCDQVTPWTPYSQLASAPSTYTAVPAPTIDTLQALILRPTAQIVVRLAAQSDAGVTLDADGLLLLLGCSITDGNAVNATVFASADVQIRGLAAGAAPVGS